MTGLPGTQQLSSLASGHTLTNTHTDAGGGSCQPPVPLVSPHPPLPQLPPLKRAATGVGHPECLLQAQAEVYYVAAASAWEQKPWFLWPWVRLACTPGPGWRCGDVTPPAASPFICTYTTIVSLVEYCVVSLCPSGGYPRGINLLVKSSQDLQARPAGDCPINHSTRDLSRSIRDLIPRYLLRIFHPIGIDDLLSPVQSMAHSI